MKTPKKYFVAWDGGFVIAHGKNKKKVLKKGLKRGATELAKYRKGRIVKTVALG